MHALGDLRGRYAADLAQVTVLRCFGIQAVGTRNVWRPTRAIPFVLVNLLPLALATAWQLWRPVRSPGVALYFGCLVFYLLVNFLVVLCQWHGCRTFHAIVHSVDRMLTDDGRTEVHAWIDRGVPQSRQVRHMLLGSLAAVLCLHVVSTVEGVDERLHISPASYLCVALTGAAGANCVYWLLRAARLAALITRWRNIRLWWIAPGRTPGIECLSRWYRIVTLWGAAGSAIPFAPVVHICRYVPGTAATVVKWTLVAIVLTCMLAFGLYSQWRLSVAVAEKRLNSLQRISRGLPSHPPSRADEVDEGTSRLYDLFDQVNGSPSGVIAGQTIASTALTLVAGALPVTVTLIAR